MVTRQPQERELARAVTADMPITPEEFPIAERRHLIEALDRYRLALDRNYRVRRYAGPDPGRSRYSAIERECSVAQSPSNEILGVIKTGLLPGNPPMRDTVQVQSEDQRDIGHSNSVESGQVRHSNNRR